MVSKSRDSAAEARCSVIDRTFPPWPRDAVSCFAQSAASGVFQDFDGTTFPEHTLRWLYQWRRPSEMDGPGPRSTPTPVLELEHVDICGNLVAGGSSGRVFKGALYYGHANFEWLLGQILLVQQVQCHVPLGQYLFELIHPQKDGRPVPSPSGKYFVKLWILDSWRTVVVDDRVPLDLFGRPLCVASRPLQLWPILLCKALLKVMSAYQILEHTAPHQAPVFTFLTSWPLEDMMSQSRSIDVSTGQLFDRLEGSSREDSNATKRCITCAHLNVRCKPKRSPPRVLVFTGPAGAAKRAIMAGLVAACPALFARVVTHTSRKPKAHEVDGVDYHFTDAPTLRYMQDEQELLDIQRLNTVHGGDSVYGVSYSAIRSVASGGKVCLVALDIKGAETLYYDDRIDAAFIYVNAPSWQELETRVAKRLKEDECTIQKRLAWATDEVAAALADSSLVDTVVLNEDDPQTVLRSLKEAAAMLSPIVRNRIYGIPQYILEYSDLVVANHVQAPFLKPIVVTGPDTGERAELLQALADEFPDVFAFAPVVSDEAESPPPDPFLERYFSAVQAPQV